MNRQSREQYKRLLRFLAVGIIVIVESLIFQFVWERYYSEGLWLQPFYARGNTVVVFVYAAFLVLFMYIYGGLKIGYFKSSNVIYSQALSGLCANAVMYFQITLLWRRLPDVMPIIWMTVLDIIFVAIVSWCFKYIFSRLFPPREMLMIYDEYSMDELLHKMNKRNDKFIIHEMIHVSDPEEKILQKIQEYREGGVVLGDLHSEFRNRILKYCYSESIRVYMTPKISDILVKGAETLHLFDTPLLLSRNYGLLIEQRFLKRIMDIILSIILIILTSPIMLITAISIKIYDKGPILFKQERLTYQGKRFNVLKFRSMVVEAEQDGVARLAQLNDERITPVGRVIRAVRIDELPQFFNILKGEMSLVGPRPERPEIAAEYEKEIPEFSYRLKVKAGLTGYAQIYGKYNTTAYDKLKLDLMYIENYSILSDFKLIFATFKILFIKESTEGIITDKVDVSEEIGNDEKNN